MSYLFSISLCLSLLFSILLLSIRDRKRANHLLATFFIFATINISYILSKHIFNPHLYIPVLTEINFTIPILYAPLLYYYSKATLLPGFRVSKRIPWMIFGYLLYLSVYSSVGLLIESPGHLTMGLVYILKPIVNIFFIVRLWFFIVDLEEKGFWTARNKHFKWWLQWLAIGGLIICLISMTAYALDKYYPQIDIPHGNYLICAFLSIYFFVLCIITFTSTTVFRGNWMPTPMRSNFGPLDGNDQNEEFQQYQYLKNYMESSTPYLDPNLSIARMSELLDLPSSKVSRLINHYGGATFFDYVNSYRVEKVKSMILNAHNDHLSLLGIAMESGFNTKASFNRTFKKYTGMTPSQYRKENLTKRG